MLAEPRNQRQSPQLYGLVTMLRLSNGKSAFEHAARTVNVPTVQMYRPLSIDASQTLMAGSCGRIVG